MFPDHSVGADRHLQEHSEDALPAFYSHRRTDTSPFQGPDSYFHSHSHQCGKQNWTSRGLEYGQPRLIGCLDNDKQQLSGPHRFKTAQADDPVPSGCWEPGTKNLLRRVSLGRTVGLLQKPEPVLTISPVKRSAWHNVKTTKSWEPDGPRFSHPSMPLTRLRPWASDLPVRNSSFLICKSPYACFIQVPWHTASA